MKLTDKQQAFINEYLKCWNATEAAKHAGYSEKTAYSIGSENLRKPEISEIIRQRIESMTMSADEALIRLSGHARGTMDDFVEIKHGIPFIDLEKAKTANQLHLLKKFKTSDKGVEIELYDAQAALAHVLKEQHLKAGEATDITDDASLTDEDRANRIAALFDAARARRDGRAADAAGADASVDG